MRQYFNRSDVAQLRASVVNFY
jgi:hypothetical protein